jgi:hypothetical protein
MRPDEVISAFNNNESTKIDFAQKLLVSQEALRRVFYYQSSHDLVNVLTKVSLINSLYSTNILDTFSVAKHIVNIDFGNRVRFGNEDEKCKLVHDVAEITIKGKTRNNYSFATKYCSFVKPSFFPIYDQYIKKSLLHFNSVNKFSTFTEKDLKDFKTFREIMFAFIDHHNLGHIFLPSVDKFLWLNGKAIKEGRPLLNPAQVFNKIADHDKRLIQDQHYNY